MRNTDFQPYGETAGGRRVSALPQHADPPSDGPRAPWPLRAADVDLHGHVNNTVYWQAIEHVLIGLGPALVRPLRARLEYREPLDLGDPLELVVTGDDDHVDVGFVADGRVKAVGDVHAATR